MSKELDYNEFIKFLKYNGDICRNTVELNYGLMDNYKRSVSDKLQVCVNDMSRVCLFFNAESVGVFNSYADAKECLIRNYRYKENEVLQETSFESSLMTTVTLDYNTEGIYEIVYKGKKKTIKTRKFCFILDTQEHSKAIDAIYGTKNVSSISTRTCYALPDECSAEDEKSIFTGINNKYVPFLKAEIRPDRVSGNTTRCVDAAIAILFDHGKVLLKDHYEKGRNVHANLDFKRKLLNRLEFEYDLRLGCEDIMLGNYSYLKLGPGESVNSANWLHLVHNS